jgi:hypothetical protein
MTNLFEYPNSWNSPRFFFQKNIGDIINELSLAHGLDLKTFTENRGFFNRSGTFTVVGEFSDVRAFGEFLESTYNNYLTHSNTDWDLYQNYDYTEQ